MFLGHKYPNNRLDEENKIHKIDILYASDRIFNDVNYKYLYVIDSIPQMARTPRTTHVVHSGINFNSMRATLADIMIKYACCKTSGPFQWITRKPTTPKFHISNDNVI